tara:strand:+ start:1437 stop:2279 length:843 start_codon:yes stop_codon:yes gene_type:complete
MARNNEDRLGTPAPAPPNVMETSNNTAGDQMFSFVTPTEFVELPSKGKFYSEGHPLHNVDTVEIRYMTAKDEDTLTSPALLKKGIAIERLLKNVIIDKSINTDDLLVGDKNAILVATRISGYGAGYTAKVTCTSCATSTDYTFDLNEVDQSLPEELEVNDDGLFNLKLPKMDVMVGLSLMTGADEKRLVKLAENRKKKGLPEAVLTDQFRMIIRSVNGSQNNEHINALIENMPATDSRYLRTAYAELSPNVDLTQDFECPECNMQEEVIIPFTTEFFWPK